MKPSQWLQGRPVVRIVLIVLASPLWILPWLLYKGFAFDLKQFSTEKDGYSPFNALATFALAQGVALTAVAKGEGRDKVVLIIYGITVAMTIFWIIIMLRSSRDDAWTGGQVRAYDRPSIGYGQFTLLWTLVLGFVMSYLAHEELLPNQTRRVPFDKFDAQGVLATHPSFLKDRVSAAVANKDNPTTPEAYDLQRSVWLQWINKGVPQTPQVQLLWVEQDLEFQDFYKTFYVRMEHNPKLRPLQRAAFLVRRDGPEGDPTYRQLHFKLDASKVTSNILVVEKPSPHERVLVLVKFENTAGGSIPSPDDYGVKLVRSDSSDVLATSN